MPAVLSDSSTLIHLAALGHLSLLREFFGRLTIPQAVWREVVEEGHGRGGAQEVEAALRDGWLEVEAVRDEALLRSLRRDLDDGEAEVLALAVAKKARLVLVDESEARRAATALGFEKTGVIGILMRARLEGKIAALRPELDRLRRRFWIQENLYRRALEAVGEAGEPDEPKEVSSAPK